MAMRKATIIKRIEAMGMGKLIITTDDEDRRIRMSCEDYVDEGDVFLQAGDYYGEFRGGYPWINPKLEKLAEQAGLYWEWENPAVICLYLD